MKYIRAKQGYILRIYKGEQLMETLQRFVEAEKIRCAEFTGIGAVSTTTFGYYDLEYKKYEFTTMDKMMEVVSLRGNVALFEGKPMLHVHGAFGDTDLKMYGGHIKEATAGITLEVFMTTYDLEVHRLYDEEIGLNLLELPCQFDMRHD